MPCLMAEAVGHETCPPSPHGVLLTMNHNLSLQKAMQRGRSCPACSALEDVKSCNGAKDASYRFHLEQEVRILQKQLQEEIDLHVALANAIGPKSEPLLLSPSKIPYKAQDLLANIAALEITVTKLEKELDALHFRFSHERNERLLAETHLTRAPALALEPPSSISCFVWKERMSSLRSARSSEHQISPSSQLDLSSSDGHTQLTILDTSSQNCSTDKSDAMDLKKDVLTTKNLWKHPNKLSEEMVRCMRDIVLCLSEPKSTSKQPTSELHYTSEKLDVEKSFDPYRVNGKVNWKNIGSYGLAAEVCWMSVGKEQLDYAAGALKNFRFLVEQLAQVNPAQMSSSEKLAFWINLYNALIMHAYLAYGVPRSDIKLFSLMQKASYTVGGQSFNAVDIEFVLLKMKPPAHRPQIGLVLALHKFTISEEHWRYSIDSPEPLVVFALSTGMYSSPAVRIFTPENVQDELKNSMKDYIQASVGIGDRGKKVLVPKLLHCFARGVVEDSLLVDWICRYLTPDQVAAVRDSASQRKQRLLGVRSFGIVPFDSRFRYLFLPEGDPSCN
ncbi:uncharacterized protein M6B38_119735 [Iris pallida]|uniref:DUF547 domain-containing protein n=1 Tax=Iris pallida TaxID=29817 RepID=A0AAX6HA73_IRIPA|nr:uncharacterized protein M6B38_119735 [Iris pallida]